MLAYHIIIQPSVVEVNKSRQMKASHFRQRAITMYSRVANDCFQRNVAKNAKKDFNFFALPFRQSLVSGKDSLPLVPASGRTAVRLCKIVLILDFVLHPVSGFDFILDRTRHLLLIFV